MRIENDVKKIVGGMLLSFFSAISTAEEFVITQIVENKIANAASSILVEAYDRLGYDVRFVQVPGERALIWSNEGRYADAEMFRIDGLEKNYPNLIKVPISYLSMNMVAFTKTADPNLSGYDNLKDYHVAYRIGLKVVEENASKFSRVSKFADADKAFEMMDKGRIDVVIEERSNGLSIIEKYGFEEIYEMSQPLENGALISLRQCEVREPSAKACRNI